MDMPAPTQRLAHPHDFAALMICSVDRQPIYGQKPCSSKKLAQFCLPTGTLNVTPVLTDRPTGIDNADRFLTSRL